MNRWYARPVFFVADIHRASTFYIDQLGFRKDWPAEGTGTVCQVSRSDCEIILCESAERRDKGRLFIELTKEGVDEIVAELAARGVPNEKSWWGYDVVKIVDPDGNELLIPEHP